MLSTIDSNGSVGRSSKVPILPPQSTKKNKSESPSPPLASTLPHMIEKTKKLSNKLSPPPLPAAPRPSKELHIQKGLSKPEKALSHPKEPKPPITGKKYQLSDNSSRSIDKISSQSSLIKAATANPVLPSSKRPQLAIKKTPQLTNQIIKIKTFKDVFEDDTGKTILTEQAVLVGTKDLLTRQLNSKIDYLKGLVDTSSEKRRERLQKKLDLTTKQRDHYAKQEGEWASTNAPRFAFENLGRAYTQTNYAPVLGNLWTHSVENGDNEPISKINRSAAITDFSHSRISLQELRDYLDLVMLANDSRAGFTKMDSEKIQNLLTLYDLGIVASTHPFKLEKKCQKKLENLIVKLKKRAIQDYGKKLTDSSGNIKPEELFKKAASRKDKLEQQVLQDLYLHFLSNPVKTSKVVYGRVALIDPIKKADKGGRMQRLRKKTSGFINSERTQSLDMHAIYSSLDGRSIFFDVEDSPDKGPYIDLDGNIHMNKSLYQGNHLGQPVILNTLFFNISAQSHIANKGIQKAINESGLKKMDQLTDDDDLRRIDYLRLKHTLENPDSDPFKRSSLAIDFCAKMGYASAGCFGAKDRTGYALALTTSKKLEEVSETFPNKQALRSKWDFQLLGKKGIAARIIGHNTGYNTMKLTQPNLKLYHINTSEGMKKRFKDYRKGIFVALSPKVIPSKSGAGQLYAPWTGKKFTASDKTFGLELN